MTTTRDGQTEAASRWDRETGLHTWSLRDRVEIEAASEDERAAAFLALHDIDRGRSQLYAWKLEREYAL